MTLVKWNSPANFPVFSNLIDNFFAGDLFDLAHRESATSVPSVNIKESEEKFLVELAAPGLNKEDFKVNIENDVLTISAEVKNENEEKSEKFTRREFKYNSFRRAFTLPKTVDSDKIEAQYNNGVLHVSLPKREEAKPKPAKQIVIE